MNLNKIRYNWPVTQKAQSDKTPTRRNGQSDKPISTKETETMINNFLEQKAPGSDGFIGKFY